MSEFLEHIKRDLAAVLAAQAMPETNDVEENAKRAAEAEASYNICSNTEQRLTKLLAVAEAALPVLRVLEARDGVLCEPEDARFSLTRSEYGDIGLKEIEELQAALAALDKPLDSAGGG